MANKRVNWAKLKKNIPSRVQIASGVFYDVFYGQDLVVGKKTSCVGVTDHDKRLILLDKGISAKETVLTYLHELTHALSFEHEIILTETQVQLIEKSLYYMLKPNNIFKGK